MNDYLGRLAKRVSGYTESETILPQVNLWQQTDADRNNLTWDETSWFSMADPGISDSSGRKSLAPDESADHVDDSSPINSLLPPSQPAEEKSGSQKEANRQTGEISGKKKTARMVPEKKEPVQSVPEKEIRVIRPETQPIENKVSKLLVQDDGLNSPPARKNSETRTEYSYMENIVERIIRVESNRQQKKGTGDGSLSTAVDRHESNTLSRDNALIDERRRFTPQLTRQVPVDIKRKKSQEEVIIENLTVEVVHEEKSEPVRISEPPVRREPKPKRQQQSDRSRRETKLRFGLGQM